MLLGAAPLLAQRPVSMEEAVTATLERGTGVALAVADYALAAAEVAGARARSVSSTRADARAAASAARIRGPRTHGYSSGCSISPWRCGTSSV